jgi:ComF family protein
MRISSIASGITPGLVNFFYPSACPACSKPTDSLSSAPFCKQCWISLERYTGPSCSRCGVPLVSTHADRCRNCIEVPPAFSKAVSFGHYEGTLASAIHHFKFLGIRRLSKPLAELLLFFGAEGIDAVIPVPLSPGGLKNRGFNQALLLAHHLSGKKNLPLLMDVLRKIVDTPPQVGLSAKERAANVRKAFACSGNVSGMNILLIDDVMTTGATVNACAKQLLRAGAKSVQVLTLARAGEI